MIHTPTKQNFAGAKFASVLSHNATTINHAISMKPRTLTKEPEAFKNKTITAEDKKYLSSEKVDLMNDTQMEAFAKHWWNSAKNSAHWIEISNEYAELNEAAIKHFYYNLIENNMITRAIKRKLFNEMFEILLFEYLSVWAVQDQSAKKRKRCLVTSKIQVWMLEKIWQINKISPTRLQNEVFKELEYKTPAIAKNALNKGLKTLVNNGCIELKKGKGYSNYILKDVEYDGNDFLRGEG